MSQLPDLPAPGWPADVADELACKFAGDFFATWLTNPAQIKAQTYRGPGLDATVRYLRSLFGLAENQYRDGQLLLWFANTQEDAERTGDPEVFRKFMVDYIQPAVTNCGASVCKALGWTGNSDLAGIGVFTSYIIEAALATIFLAVLLAKHYGLWRRGRVLEAFEGALSDLIVGVFVFSFAVMCASLNSMVTALDEPNSVTTYDVVTGTLVSIFSVCPATLLYCLSGQNLGDDEGGEESEHTSDKNSRKTFRYLVRAIFFALWVLMLAVVNLAQTTDPSKDALEAGSFGEPFEVYCQVIGSGPLQAVRIFAVASAGLGVLWMLYLAFRNMKRGQDSKSKGKNHWPVVIAVLAWIAMWFFLGVFTVMRATIIEVAGESDKSNEWGFGQIISLGTWVPVILTFFHILFFEVKEA